MHSSLEQSTALSTWYAAERRSLGVICSLAVRVFHDAFAAVKEGTASATCVGSNTTNMKHITPRRHQCSLHSVFAGRIFSDAVKAVKEGCANARQKEMVEKYHRGRKAHGREGGGAGQKKAAAAGKHTRPLKEPRIAREAGIEYEEVSTT